MNESSGPATRAFADSIDYGDGLVLPVFPEPMKEHPHPGVDALIGHANLLREWVTETESERLARKCDVPFLL